MAKGRRLQLDRRLISGDGVMRLPLPEIPIRMYWLECNLIRPATGGSLNFKYQYAKGYHATLQLMQEGFVCKEWVMEFDQQRFDIFPDLTMNQHYHVQCNHIAVLKSLIPIYLALKLVPGELGQNIFAPWEIPYDRVVFRCYKDAAIEVALYGLEVDQCSDVDPETRPPNRPPEAPEYREPYPPGTPITVSEPYNRESNDDGETNPYETDDIPEEDNDTEDCAKYTVLYRTRRKPDANYINYTAIVYGKVYGIRAAGTNDSRIEIDCKGTYTPATNEPCRDRAWYPVRVDGNGYAEVSLVSLAPYAG